MKNLQTFSVVLTQHNKAGNENFKSTAKSITVESTENLSHELADYCKETFNLFNFLKSKRMPGAGSMGIKKGSRMNFQIVCLEDNTPISIEVPNFGKWIEQLTTEELADSLSRMINHIGYFAHLWSRK